MGLFGAAHGWGEMQKEPLYLKSVMHIPRSRKLGYLYLNVEDPKNI